MDWSGQKNSTLPGQTLVLLSTHSQSLVVIFTRMCSPSAQLWRNSNGLSSKLCRIIQNYRINKSFPSNTESIKNGFPRLCDLTRNQDSESLGQWKVFLRDSVHNFRQWHTRRHPSRGAFDVSGWQANPVMQSWLMKNWKYQYRKTYMLSPEAEIFCTWSSQPPQVPRGFADSTPWMHVCASETEARAKVIPSKTKFILNAIVKRLLKAYSFLNESEG